MKRLPVCCTLAEDLRRASCKMRVGESQFKDAQLLEGSTGPGAGNGL